MSDVEDMLPCLGYYEAPMPPNNCDECSQREICRKICFEFIPRREVEELIEKVEAILKSP